MKKLVIYCHGYGSSAKTTKVDDLIKAGYDAYCFKADIDPHIAVPFIKHKVQRLLRARHDNQVTFIGTSLGGWMAAELNYHFEGSKAILINPSENPAVSLAVHDVPSRIRRHYDPIWLCSSQTIFIGLNDELLDHTTLRIRAKNAGCNIIDVPGADHRFREHFHLAFDYI